VTENEQFYTNGDFPFVELRKSTNSGRHFKPHMHQRFSIGAIDCGEVIYEVAGSQARLGPLYGPAQPGAGFFSYHADSAAHAPEISWVVCAGIAAANSIYISLAIIGFEYVSKMPLLMQVLHYAGGGYLLYLGFLLLKRPKN